jgi:hypothetical protein
VICSPGASCCATTAGFGAVTAPLVGLAGAQTAVPLGVVGVSAAVLAFVGYVLVRRPPRPVLALEYQAPA